MGLIVIIINASSVIKSGLFCVMYYPLLIR